ncbi:T9SS type B sorting domain-containing protein [Aquimarina celericrescens]|uniref:T9SS type B sorting domain-containing protein n=1 Tax=Aquimarina celericrescens TaxID=1964542 RepID=A0ABW5AX63_9FLAO|nr:T9SS type B sorting domain-containing protein [Aquimarina celericrescens]
MKLYRNSLFTLILLCSLVGSAQNEASVWYFGRLSGLDFGSGAPTALINGQMITNEGCSTISDSNGDLLFYTNGVKVWNKNHQLMANGTDLHGHWSSTQSSIIVPQPGSDHIYYIVTVDEPQTENAAFYPDPNPDPLHINIFDPTSDSDDGLNNGLNYSIVDMNLNAGLGEVISKNNHLVTYNPSDIEQVKLKCSEKISAVYNEDESVVWVVTHFIDKFYAFRIDASGMNPTPVTSASRSIHPISGYTYNAIGNLKFSPDGTKLAMANWSEGTIVNEASHGSAYLYDFDKVTGRVSGGVQLLNLNHPYGVEFSPDSKKLYATVQEFDSFSSYIYQFDLNATDIPASGHRYNAISDAGSLQLGIDGKIYIAMPNMDFISQINDPNALGDLADVEFYSLFLEGRVEPYREGKFGFPTFIQSFFETSIVAEDLCFVQDTQFNLSNTADIASVLWNFGDPSTSAANTSTDLEPVHRFSAPGTYTVSVTVTTTNGVVSTIDTEITISEIPIAHMINDVKACEDRYNFGYSSNFDVSTIEAQVLGGQTGMVVSYFDQSFLRLPSPLPNPYTNDVKDRETITVRVASADNPMCYSETSFDLIVEPLPLTNPVTDIYACDDNTDGITSFDVRHVEATIFGGQTGLTIEYLDGQGVPLPSPLPNMLTNSVRDRETITALVSGPTNNCKAEVTFDLVVNPQPIANTLEDLIGCDDNDDGISEYFDTSGIESMVIGDQTNMTISYYDILGNPISLSNPYTNRTAFQQEIIVRITNTLTSCSAETMLVLNTSSKPKINTPQDIYACDEGDGYASFDTSQVISEIIDNQTGLNLLFSDYEGNPLPDLFSGTYQNSIPYVQTVFVRVENALNATCYSETSFDLLVNPLPEIDLEPTYSLCDLDPSLYIMTPADFDSWVWIYEDGTLVSDTFEADLVEEGGYTLTVNKTENGILCENSFSFTLIRSELPSIRDVNFSNFADNNYIEILASGDGDFEYSIDGTTYQDSNYFDTITGGTYTVFVRDKNGCGEDSKEITVIDHPKYFTPNGDGFHDYWQIRGIENHPTAIIHIYDRLGKLLKQLSAQSIGWDGTYNGKVMPSSEYWFSVDLRNGKQFKGHFSIIR